MQEFHKNEIQRYIWQLTFICHHFGQRRRSQGPGISKGKQVIYRWMRKGEQILAGPLRNNGTQREVQQTGFARFLPVCQT